MKPLLLVGLLILLLCAACTQANNAGTKLTDENVKAALTKWMPDCPASVVGIQEIPQENIAKANLYFSHCEFAYHGPNIRPGTKSYSGSGEAILTHYNDGRWVLTQVSAKDGWPPFQWENLGIEVK